MLNVKMGASSAQDPAQAVQELFKAIDQPNITFALFYSASTYSTEALAQAFNHHFAGIDLIGCTSAGEISPAGYNKESLIGLSIASDAFTVVSERIDNLNAFQLAQGKTTVTSLKQQLANRGKTASPDETFGFLLIDGLSRQEEKVVHALYRNMGNIQLFGGSAADGQQFETTYVFHEGAFHTNSALFSLIHTTLPFTIFKTEHFHRTNEDIVVTEADVSQRTVSEINGLPAVQEYARASGFSASTELTPAMFATHPVAVSIGGENFVRSIMRINEDGTISFACAIDEGIVLSVAEPDNLIDDLQQAMQNLKDKIGQPQLVLGCDCLFRMLEMEHDNIKDEVGRILAENNVFAFSTYGEQYNGMHVNQTFTGVAIGA